MVPSVCLWIVGLIFVVAGTIKALDARHFLREIGEYQLLPARWIAPTALALVALEVAVGVGLLVRLADLLIPLAAVILLAFAGLTLWGASTGRTEDCGC